MRADLVASAPVTAGILGAVITDRLLLRPMDEEATDTLVPVFSKEEVWRYPLGRGLTTAETESFVRDQVDHWQTLGYGLWLVLERASGRAIGFVGMAVPTFLPEVLPVVEVGWRLDPDVWGRGYATEGGRAALDAAFTVLGLPEVVSLPQVDNGPSVRVAERLGMRRRRTAVVPASAKRGPVEVAVMAMTLDEHSAR